MNDQSPLNSVARQLVHLEAGRGVRTVLVGGKIVVRDRKLTTVDETTIYEAVKAVMPGFRKDFATISARTSSATERSSVRCPLSNHRARPNQTRPNRRRRDVLATLSQGGS